MFKKKYLLISFFLIFVLTLKLFFFKISFIEDVASFITYPVIYVSSVFSSPVKKFFKNRASAQELENSCKRLEEDCDLLRQENIKLLATLKYAEKTRDLSEFKNRYDLKNAITSKILLRTLNDSEHSILVNRGKRDGIEKNMVAIYKFQLVGKVTEVFSCHSKVTLITDKKSKVSCFTNSSNAAGIVEGKNVPNKCFLKYVSHLSSVLNDDLVLSSGQGMVFPEGFCLGKIIHSKKEDVCHYIEIEPLFDFSNLEICLLTNQSRMNLF